MTLLPFEFGNPSPTTYASDWNRIIMPRKLIAGVSLLGLLALLTACADRSTSASLAVAAPAATSPASPAAEPVKPAPQRLTAREINEACWLSPEINKVPDLDKRAKLVDKCVDARTKAQQGM
jgi:hypothetical protein